MGSSTEEGQQCGEGQDNKRQPGRGKLGCLSFYFANYTEWGPKAEEYLDRQTMRDFHLHLGVETHLAGTSLRAARRARKKRGYRTYTCPADETGRGGNSGGTWVMVQKHLSSHGALPGFQLQEGVPHTRGEQWTAAMVRVKGFDLVFIAAYLESGVGLNETNMRRLGQISEFLKLITVPFIVMADWNMEPSELLSVAWPSFAKGQIVTPKGATFTCSKGKGRLLDYAVVSNPLVPYFSLELDLESPWKPHIGLKGTVGFEIEAAQSRIMLKPKHMETCQGPVWEWNHYLARAEQEVGSVEPTYPVDSVAYTNALSQKYALFSRAAELVLCDQASIGRESISRSCGRGNPTRFRVGPSQPPTKPYSYTHDPASNYWAACHNRLSELLRFKLHRGVVQGASGHERLVSWFRKMGQHVGEWEQEDVVGVARVASAFQQIT